MMERRSYALTLVFSIAATLCCCLPLGIVSIVFSAIAMSRQSSGNYVGAAEAARVARICNWISFGFGAAVVVIYVLLILLGVAGSLLGPTGSDLFDGDLLDLIYGLLL